MTKDDLIYALSAARTKLLAAIWSATRAMEEYPQMDAQYRHVRHELVCALIVMDVSMTSRGEERGRVFKQSAYGLREYVTWHQKRKGARRE